MHKVLEGKIDAIFRPTVLFSYTSELEVPELTDDETDLPQNIQNNGTTPPVGTQPSSLQSPLEDTYIALA